MDTATVTPARTRVCPDCGRGQHLADVIENGVPVTAWYHDSLAAMWNCLGQDL
jgi:hypothetical protein